MQILLAISVANSLLLLWCAVAIAGLRRTQREMADAADEARTSELVLPDRRAVPERRAEPDLADRRQHPERAEAGDRRLQPDRRKPVDTLYGTATPSAPLPPAPGGAISFAPDLAQSRKIRYASTGRLDPAYFNKDAGDLTDPEAPMRTRPDGSRSTRRY